jgi:hypothetical protein
MATLNHSVTAALALGETAPLVDNSWDTEERTGTRGTSAESAEQTDGCPLLRGILIATIPALLMWAAILGLAAKFL